MMTLALTGLTSGNPLPGNYIEVSFAQGAAAGDLGAKKVLLLAPSTAAGTIVQDTEIYGPISSVDEAELKGGSGSPLHRMAKKFLSIAKGAQVYLCAPTRSAGTQGTLVLTLAVNATGAGVAKILFCEESIEFSFLTGDTPTVIAAGLVAAFNAKTHLPATAANAAGVITLTAKIAGPEGNALRAQAGVSTGVATTFTPSVETAFTSGATAAVLTTALNTIVASRFNTIVPYTHTGTTTDAQLALLAQQVTTQAQPLTGIRQRVLAGVALSPSNSVSLAQSINKPRVDIVNFRNCPIEPWVVAAGLAAVWANTYFVNPATNLDGYGGKADHNFPIPAPRDISGKFSQTEQIVMLQGGVTPIGLTDAGTPVVVREITSYSLNGATADYRVRDSHRVWVADDMADRWAAKLATMPWQKLSEDPPNDVQPGASFCTPRRAKAMAETLISEATDAENLDPAKKLQALSELAVGIDPIVPTRLNVRIPVYSANLIHQTASLFAESSAAA